MTVIDEQPVCFYHPIKIVFLDENDEFSEVLNYAFRGRINGITLANQDTTLRFIENHNQDNIPLPCRFESWVNRDTISPGMFAFESATPLNLLYDKQRFNKVPVLVIDSEISGINGIEFCIKLQEKKVFKIMLAASADKDIALEAFNKGLIDKFILKTNKDLYSELTKAAQELTQRYFKESLYHQISMHSLNIRDLFENKLYQQLFAEVSKQAKAVEYYLINHSGSILFLDKDASPTWLIVSHINEVTEQFDLLEGYDLPEEIMNFVAKKEKILFLVSEKEYKKPAAEWINHLFDSKKLDDNYYYSIVEGPITDFIEWDRVVSYSDQYNKNN